MKRTISILSLVAGASIAQAETATQIPAIDHAVEVAASLSGTEGSGRLGGGMQSFDDVADKGLTLDLAVGYRLTPNLLLGGYTTFAGHGTDADDTGAVTFAAGIKADWHFQPSARFDPWVGVGTGVKLMGIETGGQETSLTGLELAKLQVGLDYRISPRFAIGPVVGASATMYRTQYDMAETATDIDDKTVNWTVTVGFLGRYDAFGAVR